MGGKIRKKPVRSRAILLEAMRAHLVVIGKERDSLRELNDELSDVLNSTEDGLRDIEYGIDRLSEHA